MTFSMATGTLTLNIMFIDLSVSFSQRAFQNFSQSAARHVVSKN